MSRCRSCDAPITWARTTTGKNIPLDADDHGEPVDVDAGGLVFISWEGPRRIVRAQPGVAGYRAHFSSCPNADAHRRSR